jgi:hypothetical protein
MLFEIFWGQGKICWKIFVDKIFAYNIMPKDSRAVRYHWCLMGVGRYRCVKDFFRLHDAYKK